MSNFILPKFSFFSVIVFLLILFSCTSIPKKQMPLETQESEIILEPEKTLEEQIAELKPNGTLFFHPNTVIFQTEKTLPAGNRESRKWETSLGDFIADSVTGYFFLHEIPVDFTMINSEMIRAGLPQGNVTKQDIQTMLPIEDALCTVFINGKQLEKLFEYIGGLSQGNDAFPQISKELRYTINYDSTGIHGEISNVSIKGIPLNPENNYIVACNSYFLAGNYNCPLKAMDGVQIIETGLTVQQAVLEYSCSLKTVYIPATDGRITVVGGIVE